MHRDPCKQCGNSDRYVKGKFSYCRPCHNESSRRYHLRKSQGMSIDRRLPPARKLADMLTQQPSSPRCPQGHLMSGDNVRIASQRKGRHLERKCRACERERKRVSYGLQPEPTPTRLSELLE